jgi:hypothetical protein
VRKRDTPIQVSGHRAERLLVYSVDAADLEGGTLTIGAEYGRVEIMESDDGTVRLQVRCEALGEGATQAIQDTDVQVRFTAHRGRLGLAVWHTTQGFTPAAQPCLLNIRLQVPPSGAYQIEATAHHGGVGIHRIRLAGGTLRGRVGVKVKGIQGYLGGHDLDHVTLAGDLAVVSEGGMISGTVSAASSCKLTARTGTGDVRLSFTPDPRLGLNVTAGSEAGSVRLDIGQPGTTGPVSPQMRTTLRARTEDYDRKPVQVEVTAMSTQGNVVVVSWL